MKYLALLMPVLLAGCGATDDAQIRALEGRLGQAVAAHDFDTAMRCYARDAVLLLPGQARLEGREAIGKFLRASFADARNSIGVMIDRVEVDAAGELAFAYGTGLTTAGGPGAPQTSASKWLAVFRKRDGAWEIAADTVD
jgi:uncharacterized protein (TIGR02246 family)